MEPQIPRKVITQLWGHGTTIGQCLYDALDELKNEDENKNKEDNNNNNVTLLSPNNDDDDDDTKSTKRQKLTTTTTTTKTITVNSESINQIMNAFGNAVATTLEESQKKQQQQQQEQQNEKNSTTPVSTTTTTTRPPTVMVKARLDHYNRIGQHWRIQMDHLEMKKRKQPSHQTNNNNSNNNNNGQHPFKQSRQRQSLWDVAFHETPQIFPEETKLQILAYNDT